MIDITTFLIRWFFLSNLLQDVAEIQTLPQYPYHPQNHHSPGTSQHHHHPEHHPISADASSGRAHTPLSLTHPGAQSTQQRPSEATRELYSPLREEVWRDQCLRGILQYPPGTQRLLVMDAFRVELVQQLAQTLHQAENCRQRLRKYKRRKDLKEVEELIDEDGDDPFLDTDVEIVKAFENRQEDGGDEIIDPARPTKQNESYVASQREVKLEISGKGTQLLDDREKLPDAIDDEVLVPPSSSEVALARETLSHTRQYLPQLVSAVLKSAPAVDPSLANPIRRLRQLMLQQCLKDPSWGVDLCWLLEADVGRAWKTLFEHRQQTGRRLIVVMPAEKAAVLAKIGSEKREAFDLMQDAEQATAYGYAADAGEPVDSIPEIEDEVNHGKQNQPHVFGRLPSSLSLRRCSHFGDTMHFIDRLTKISLDMQMVPTLERREFLIHSLEEMNRRIRRRMVTRGDVSLDVEDSRGPYDWPQINDLTADRLQYSVHFPLVPQTVTWPTGDGSTPSQLHSEDFPQVVRVLNIVSPESRILASRERCPFLVHLEVIDTGFEGNDARLYAAGASGLGATVKEALSMGPSASRTAASTRKYQDFSFYEVPADLYEHAPARVLRDTSSRERNNTVSNPDFARGGWQPDQSLFHEEGFLLPEPFEDIRQQEYEQLHQQMQQSPDNPPTPPQMQRPLVSTRSELLERIFGTPWEEKCKRIRSESPFGQLEGWRLASFIMKAGEDIRKEALTMQIISKFKKWFEDEIPLSQRPFLRPYTIMCVGGDAGLLECLSDSKSLDEVKKRTDHFVSLREYFERAYGHNPSSEARAAYYAGSKPNAGLLSLEEARDNFLRSLVGYSLVCYVLQVKDRHNGNILIDRDGHIMHIDFGFVLGDTPKMGKVPIFSERAPFKLSTELWEVLGGWNIKSGGLGVQFCKMFELAFACASAHADEIATLVEGAVLALNSNPRAARIVANGVRARLRMRGPPGSIEQKSFIMDLVNAALTSWGTSTYDWLQRNMNGYQ